MPWISCGCRVLPFIASRAREVSSHFPVVAASAAPCVALPLIAAPAALTMTREHALCVLSAQFLGILPHGSPTSDEDRGDCNIAVFSELIRSRGHEQVAKLQCYLQYFVTHMSRWTNAADGAQHPSYSHSLCFRRCSTESASTVPPAAAPQCMPCFQQENALIENVGSVDSNAYQLKHINFVDAGKEKQACLQAKT